MSAIFLFFLLFILVYGNIGIGPWTWDNGEAACASAC